MTDEPTFYFDLGSPYAYLAAERVDGLLGRRPKFEPILVGGIFVMRGRGSWSLTPDRAAGLAEVERRAERYGLPPVDWPSGWPNNTLKAMRAAVWAREHGRGAEFALAGFRRAFVDGADLSAIEELPAIAESVGLPGDELPSAIERPSIKEDLKRATAGAWDLGVRGVPCLSVGGEVFYGDDRLEAAAAALGDG